MGRRVSALRQSIRRHNIRVRIDVLEDRSVPAVVSFGGDAQHTGISSVASQPLQATHWQASVDDFFSTSYGHYGAPLVTDANTVIFPHKTTVSANFHMVGRNGVDGTVLWDVATDFEPPSNGWFPPYQPALATATNRVYFAGKGGTVYYRTNPDSAIGTVSQVAFYGTLGHYTSNQAAYDNNVFIDTPLTIDNQGNVFFGFRVTGNTGSTPTNLISGIARISSTGVGSWVSAEAAAGGDTSIDRVARNSAPALSNDGSILYFGTRATSTSNYARLVGVNTTTLASQHVSGILKDPRNAGANNAGILNDSTSAPMVGPDGKVFFGVFGNPSNGSRGWLLQFSANLQTQYTPGGFGWDNTPTIVPVSMVPQYTGTSSYLIFSKYNNYYGPSDGGDGSNMICVLDPNDTEVEFHASSNGQLVMKRVLIMLSPTPDWQYPGVPTARREWCLNTAAIDPATNTIIVNNSDGYLYRWHLPTNTLINPAQITAGLLQPYTMTVITMDGSSLGIADGIMFSVGRTPGFSITDTTLATPSTTASFTVTLDYPRTTPITVHYATANGSATAGTNYTATSGDFTFTPGQMSKTINVPVNPGSVTGASGNFFVNLTSPTNSIIVDGQGQATLLGRPPRVQSVVVNGGDPQRSRVTSLAVNFDQIVTLPGTPASAFQLVRQSDGLPITLSAIVSNTASGTVATLSFIGGPLDFGSLSDGLYTLTVVGTAVSNIAGQLDGNANGTGGDDYVMTGSPANGLFRIFGDADGDGNVASSDFIQFRLAFGGTSTIFDFDGDGSVSTSDFIQFRLRFGGSV